MEECLKSRKQRIIDGIINRGVLTQTEAFECLGIRPSSLGRVPKGSTPLKYKNVEALICTGCLNAEECYKVVKLTRIGRLLKSELTEQVKELAIQKIQEVSESKGIDLLFVYELIKQAIFEVRGFRYTEQRDISRVTHQQVKRAILNSLNAQTGDVYILLLEEGISMSEISGILNLSRKNISSSACLKIAKVLGMRDIELEVLYDYVVRNEIINELKIWRLI